uniref:non-specific serine/threonine protein kinase n=1 Tax=Plectus sambesii TaxID=2011161 RepID=A0A914VEW0_9BILA
MMVGKVLGSPNKIWHSAKVNISLPTQPAEQTVEKKRPCSASILSTFSTGVPRCDDRLPLGVAFTIGVNRDLFICSASSDESTMAQPQEPREPHKKLGEIKRKSSLSIHDARIAGLYDLEHTIGQGHFAVVKLARHVFTGEKVAVKVIDKTKLDPISTAHIMQEVRCMKLVQHPNIVRLYEVIDTQTKLFLILELGDYDMYDYIMRHNDIGCSEIDAQQHFNQIIKAIDYCHTLHVVHRDLKPENVVFFEKLGMVKLTDFGFSNLFTPGQQLETSCGSLAYSAPEILLGDAYDAPAV